MEGSEGIPHVIAAPFIWPGHLAPMLQLCKCLAASGCKVTLLKVPDTAADTNKVHFDEGVKIVSGLPLPPPELPPGAGEDQKARNERLEAVYEYFKQFQGLADAALGCIQDLYTAQEGGPAAPATCILSDVYVGWALDVAKKLEIPWCPLWTSTVAELVIYYHMPDLMNKEIFPFAGPPSDEPITCIPGLPKLRPVDYPFLGFIPKSPLHPILLTFKTLVQRIPESKMLLVNSVYELEKSPVESLRSSGINVQPVGPLHILASRHCKEQGQHKETDKKKDDPVIKWLNSKPALSVLYVAFGQTMPAAEAEYAELAAAIEESGYNFLWAMKQASWLPEGFESRMRSSGRGMVVPFVPQVAVLSHPSVGAFVTHCGWNSVLEAMAVGVPMVAMPLTADEVLTKKFLTEDWGVAVGCASNSGISYKDEIRAAIESVMGDGPEARRLRDRGAKTKDAVLEAVKLSSSNNLKEFISLLFG